VLGQTGVAGDLDAVVDVGPNIGINLCGLRRLLGDRVALTAVHPTTSPLAGRSRAARQGRAQRAAYPVR